MSLAGKNILNKLWRLIKKHKTSIVSAFVSGIIVMVCFVFFVKPPTPATMLVTLITTSRDVVGVTIPTNSRRKVTPEGVAYTNDDGILFFYSIGGKDTFSLYEGETRIFNNKPE